MSNINTGKYMIKHIVMWKISDSTDMKLYEEQKPVLRDSFNNLHKLIPEIKHIEFRENVKLDDSLNYDLALLVEFDSLDDLNVYIPHLEHQKLVAIIKSLNLHRACIDL